MSSFQQEELLFTKPRKLSDGSTVIGETVIEGPSVGEALVGRGDAGVGQGAGSNIFKANAIQEILKRGIGADNDWSNEIGLIGKATGVTTTDIENAEKTQNMKRLSRQYDSVLEESGARKVEWGDTEATVQRLLKTAQENKDLAKSEPKRIKAEKEKAALLTKATNREIRADNRGLRAEQREEKRHAEQVAYQKGRDKVMDKRYDLEQDRLAMERSERRLDRLSDRKMQAENNAMQMQLEYARLAAKDKENAQARRDKNIMLLMQGLGSLGEAFTI